jgi:hypothetical protein
MGDGGIALIDLLDAREVLDRELKGARVGWSRTPSILVEGPDWCDLYSRWSSR